ncbi:type I restriction-modification system, S subunit [Streptococcus pneumoniae]|nr:type I restriction-modification system, S subunit [Streptococcus pneumoniae]VRQ91403.1 type I restriction-modification system, S subunit [Streptococcus pneumoniae]
MVEIVRGGSPRPIKDYLTSEVDGINWIKIGDTEKGEKYINNVKEKIKKSGLNKTRFVKKGTFLLTNSMSFGRPYILNVDGAIHDGWLAISNYQPHYL